MRPAIPLGIFVSAFTQLHSYANTPRTSPNVTAGEFRLITTGSASSLDHLFLIFRLMSQDFGNDLECAELIFLRPGEPIVSAHNLLTSMAMTLQIGANSMIMEMLENVCMKSWLETET